MIIMFRRKKSQQQQQSRTSILKFRHSYELTVISCGDTGELIGAGIVDNLKPRGADVHSLLVTSGKVHKSEFFNKVISIDTTKDGFAKNLDEAIAAVERSKEVLSSAIADIVPKNREQMLIVTTGAGATGLGSTLKVLEILEKE